MLTPAQALMLNRIREMQPVSEARLGAIKGPARRAFKALVDKGLLEPAGKGMLGPNWRVANIEYSPEH
jgi:hypothetical protein